MTGLVKLNYSVTLEMVLPCFFWARLVATDNIQESLALSGIGNFQVYLIEHVVRLLEIRIAAIYLGEEEAQQIRDENAMFVYLTQMENRLINQFEADRNRYPTYKDFIPELVSVIE